MAEGKPPYGDIHPMRAIFMIPTKPPPSFREPDQWSSEFIDFVSGCLVKNPEERATASELLQHEFIGNAKQPSILGQLIAEAHEIRENQSYRNAVGSGNRLQQKPQITEESDEDDCAHNKTMMQYNDETLVPNRDGTMIAHTNSATLVPNDTMVINSDSDEPTMKRHDTGPGESGKKYRPLFLDHFDKKEVELPTSHKPELENQRFQSHIQLQLIPGGGDAPEIIPTVANDVLDNVHRNENEVKFQRAFVDGDFEFLKFLSYEELQQRMSNLDAEMEREIDELRRRYQTKRQPILDAMDTKRKRQQNF